MPFIAVVVLVILALLAIIIVADEMPTEFDEDED